MTAPLALLRTQLAVIATALVSACAATQTPQPGDDADYQPVLAPEPVPQAQNNGGIFQAAHSQGLFEDFKARDVGDILTVVLSESTNAQKSASTSTDKESNLELGNLQAFGRGATLNGQPLFSASNSSTRDFEGSGDSSQSNQLDGEITVTVAEVLPNGNLVVQGEKWLGINQGEEYVRFRGIVRPVDVTTDNTVLSTQVANARVYYGGSGALADSNTPGWITRFFNSPIWPF